MITTGCKSGELWASIQQLINISQHKSGYTSVILQMSKDLVW